MSIITTQEKTRQLAEKFEESIRRNPTPGGYAAALPQWYDGAGHELTEEDRHEREAVEVTRASLQNGIYRMFDELAANVKLARYLVCAPRQLAYDLYMGSNDLLRLIASNDPGHDRYLLAEYLRKSVFPTYHAVPTMRQTALFHRQFNEGVPTYRLAECYWLFHFSQWLGCADAHFSTALTEVLNAADAEIDFRSELKADDPLHQRLHVHTDSQYRELVAVLHDL